jgi:hypothetical protein
MFGDGCGCGLLEGALTPSEGPLFRSAHDFTCDVPSHPRPRTPRRQRTPRPFFRLNITQHPLYSSPHTFYTRRKCRACATGRRPTKTSTARRDLRALRAALRPLPPPPRPPRQRSRAQVLHQSSLLSLRPRQSACRQRAPPTAIPAMTTATTRTGTGATARTARTSARTRGPRRTRILALCLHTTGMSRNPPARCVTAARMSRIRGGHGTAFRPRVLACTGRDSRSFLHEDGLLRVCASLSEAKV